MRRPHLKFLFLFGSILLCGCDTLQMHGGDPLPALSFDHVQAVSLPVSEVRLPVAYIESYERGEAVEDFRISIPEAIHHYFERKLTAAGANGTFEIVLEEINMDRIYVPSEHSAMALFKLGASYRYELDVFLALRMFREDGTIESGHRLSFAKNFSIPIDHSIAKREAKQFMVVEGLLADIDRGVNGYLIDAGYLAAPEGR